MSYGNISLGDRNNNPQLESIIKCLSNNTFDTVELKNLVNTVDVCELTNIEILPNQDNLLEGYTSLVSGLNNFDTETGIFNSKDNSIYMYTISIKSEDSNGNNILKIRTKNQDNDNLFGIDCPLSEGECFGFLNNSGILTTNDFIKYSLSTDVAPLTCDVVVRFIKLFSSSK